MNVERLTGWKENGRAYVIGCPEFELPEEANKVIQNLADKHATVEDILGDEYDLDRLRELVEADKDGRCVVLPFKPPKMAWTCNANDPKPVKAFYLSAMGIMADMKAECVFGDTPEAAEAALKAKSEG